MLRPKKLVSTRENLIKVGESLFSQQGFHAVSIRDLAAAAQTNVASIHYHFGDKYGLYEAVLRDHFEDVKRKVEEAGVYQKKPKERLLLVNRIIQKLLGEKIDSTRMMYQTFMSGDAKLRQITQEILEQSIKPLTQNLRSASAACHWKGCPQPAMLQDSFVFVIMALNIYWALFAKDFHLLFKRSAKQLTQDSFKVVEALLENFAKELPA